MTEDDNDWDSAAKAVPELRFLKALVTGLTLVMGLGMIAIVALLWMRLGQPVLPDLPANIELPPGASVAALTFAGDRIVVVTGDAQILLYDKSGRLQGSADLKGADQSP
ncbi:DUF6476 family protein [Paracoccus seriniphilus]|uniref:Uncharacterized protein n=1 Tax=Paracoccus seriniphilus TaxID=184748 RepID=A0A239PWP5_9RHOB|nr:DUF6476 family protein [Paracoccus seriniphilus]WCR13178.1 hypothetical protein JHW44_09520 [Paracoccus seriniphilus]SNT74508.1 hypothetical protein SAMN05444959_10822 [Paracoccus seriniphilus]